MTRMLGLLGLGKVKTIAMVAGLVAVAVVIGGLYWWNTILRDDLRTSEQNNAALQVALSTQQEAVNAALANAEEWEEAYNQLSLIHEELQVVEQKSSSEVRRLRDIFARHDLSALALARPGLVERRVNDGTADALSVLQRITSGDLLEAAGSGGSARAPTDPQSRSD